MLQNINLSLPQTFTLSCTELARCKLDLAELSSLIQKLLWHEGGLPITSTDLERRISMQVSLLLCWHRMCLLSFCHSQLTQSKCKIKSGDHLMTVAVLNNEEVNMVIVFQNLSLEKPKKKSGKLWGHSRTLSRVESLDFVSSSRLCSLFVVL